MLYKGMHEMDGGGRRERNGRCDTRVTIMITIANTITIPRDSITTS